MRVVGVVEALDPLGRDPLGLALEEADFVDQLFEDVVGVVEGDHRVKEVAVVVLHVVGDGHRVTVFVVLKEHKEKMSQLFKCHFCDIAVVSIKPR